MKEQLVSYDTAIMAKERGFEYNDPYYVYVVEKHTICYDSCRTYEQYACHKSDNVFDSDISLKEGKLVSAPTQSLLQKWLREVHNINIQIALHKAGYKEYKVEIYKVPEDSNEYIYFYIKEEDGVYIKQFHKYEEALEIGLQEALKLI